MQQYGTAQLLAKATISGPAVYWDDFLGDNDTDIFGKPLNRGEDRLFSTSVAINALLDTWSYMNGSTNAGIIIRKWRPNTPNNVRQIITNAVNWLNSNILTNNYEPENAFFSGSMKTMATVRIEALQSANEQTKLLCVRDLGFTQPTEWSTLTELKLILQTRNTFHQTLLIVSLVLFLPPLINKC